MLEALEALIGTLSPLAPTHLRESLKDDAAPATPEHLIVDLVTLAPGYAIGANPARYDLVSVQVGAWAKSSVAAHELAQTVRETLEADLWRVQSALGQRDGRYAGVVTTYQKQF